MDQASIEAKKYEEDHESAFVSTGNDALSADSFLRKPLPNLHEKQLLKTLRYLRDDLYDSDCEDKRPSTWILKNVVRIVQPSRYRPQYWQRDLAAVLNVFKPLIELEKEGVRQFYKEDMTGYLFPTPEGYKLDDLEDFLRKIEAHLQKF